MQFPPGVFGVLRSAKVSVGLLKRCHQCIDPRTRNLTTKLPQRNDTLCGERQACQDHHTHDDTKVRRHMMQRNDLHGKACDQRRQHQAREHKRAFALVGSTQVDDDSGALAVRIGAPVWCVVMPRIVRRLQQNVIPRTWGRMTDQTNPPRRATSVRTYP